MLKASNNHFGNRSKIKIPKIRPFCNLKSTKIAKKWGKIFSAPILEDTTCTKHFKNYTKWKRRSNAFTSRICFSFLRMPHPSKFMPNKVIIPFYAIFEPIKLEKGLIFYISKQDLSSIWLFNTFNIPFLYIDLKYNQIEHKFCFEISKIRPFFNLMGAKIA